MGTDRRLGRSERSGRYGSEGGGDDPEWYGRQTRKRHEDYDRGWMSDRHRNGHRDRYSPERRRRRRSSDRSDDEYEGEFYEHDNRMEEEENHTIMLRGLPYDVTEEDIRVAFEHLQGPQPVDIRLMKKSPGISRGFAFVEFYHLQDSTRWMETNQNKLVILGKSVGVHYSNRKQKYENWLCSACGLYNFRKRTWCYKCGGGKTADDAYRGSDPTAEHKKPEEPVDTLILRNIAPVSTVEGVMNILAPFVILSAGNVRLLKDKQTGQNRGFAFVQLSSTQEASQLLSVLQSLQPPLRLDGKTVGVDFARTSRKDLFQPEAIKSNVQSAASIAIAAAQWSSTQLPHSSKVTPAPFEAYRVQSQVPAHQVWSHPPEGLSGVAGDGLLGAAPAGTVLIPSAAAAAAAAAASSVMVSQTAHMYHPAAITQAAAQPHQSMPPQQTAGTSSVTPGSSAEAPTVCSAPAVDTTVLVGPDTFTYHYDESSGYYYNPQTGLYFDSTSQFYYNCKTQQYLYWDAETRTYIPAPTHLASSGESTATASSSSAAAGTSAKEPKDKKEKPKTITAQKIAKDMERWAKSLNRHKESSKTSQSSSVPKEEERKESGVADAAFSLFEKKMDKIGSLDISALLAAEQEASLKHRDVAPPSMEEYEREEAAPERAADEEGRITDWKKMVCLLCRRQFPTKEALLRHQQLSDLHKQNLEIQRKSNLFKSNLEYMEMKETELKYRDRAAERREKFGIPEPPAPKKKFYQPVTPVINYEQPTKDGLSSDNIGSKMLQAMGWQEGRGLGRHQQGITTPVAASLRTKGTGLGIKGSSYKLSPSDTFKDAVHKATLARYNEMD